MTQIRYYKNLSKKNIVNNLNKKLGISNNYLKFIISDLIEIFINELIIKKKVVIKNFGTFSLRNKKNRIGRNPNTLKLYKINSRVVVLFRTSKYLKNKLNLLSNV